MSEINLLPLEVRLGPLRYARPAAKAVLSLGVAALLAYYPYTLLQEVRNLREETSRFDSERAKYEAAVRKKKSLAEKEKQLADREAFLQDKASSRSGAMLAELSDLLPDSVALTRVSIGETGAVTIVGTAASLESVSMLLEGLASSQHLRVPEILYARQGEGGLYDFEIRCTQGGGSK